MNCLDYNFLSEIEKTNSRARRSAATQHLPYSLGKLQTLAKKRNVSSVPFSFFYYYYFDWYKIHVSFMPQVMTRRKENTTWFDKEYDFVFFVASFSRFPLTHLLSPHLSSLFIFLP